jgi:anti-anti-sigma factor
MWVADSEGMRPYAEAGHDAAADPAPPDLNVARVEIVLNGELDLHTLSHLHARLERVLSLRPKHVVIELAGCPFIDATAISFLMDAHRQLWLAGGLLSLRSPSDRIRRILRAARVDTVLDVTPAGGQAPDGRPTNGSPEPSAMRRTLSA